MSPTPDNSTITESTITAIPVSASASPTRSTSPTSNASVVTSTAIDPDVSTPDTYADPWPEEAGAIIDPDTHGDPDCACVLHLLAHHGALNAVTVAEPSLVPGDHIDAFRERLGALGIDHLGFIESDTGTHLHLFVPRECTATVREVYFAISGSHDRGPDYPSIGSSWPSRSTTPGVGCATFGSREGSGCEGRVHQTPVRANLATGGLTGYTGLPVPPSLPAHKPSGVLPPYLPNPGGPAAKEHCSPYKVDMAQVVKRFATSARRIELLEGLLQWRDDLRTFGVSDGFQWLDGSFVEDLSAQGREPGDIDVVAWHLPPERPEADYRNNLHLFHKVLSKQRYGIEVFVKDLRGMGEDMVRDVAYWYGLFSHRRRTEEWKGLVQVPLGKSDRAAATAIGVAKKALGIT